MKKRIMGMTLAIIMILSLSTTAFASSLPISDMGEEHWNAPGNSVVITYDGSLDLVRVDFIHYAKSNAKSTRPVKPSKTELGYELMKVKWLWQEGFAINYTGMPETLSETAVSAIINASAQTWDAATTCSKTTNSDLFSYGSATTDATYGVYDNINTIAFGDYDNPNVIAITSVWYSKATKSIFEFDMLFNTAFNWSTAGDSDAMDLQNIATHEFGHAVGLADIYNETFNYVTMYGYAAAGETSKATLDDWDILGLRTIYGE